MHILKFVLLLPLSRALGAAKCHARVEGKQEYAVVPSSFGPLPCNGDLRGGAHPEHHYQLAPGQEGRSQGGLNNCQNNEGNVNFCKEEQRVFGARVEGCKSNYDGYTAKLE